MASVTVAFSRPRARRASISVPAGACAASRTLDAVSPLATLGRGFSVVSRAEDGALLRDAAQAPAGTEIEARLARGRLRATVTKSTEAQDD